MIKEIWQYITIVAQSTWALYSGGIITVGFALCKWRLKRDLSWKWLSSAVMLALVIAGFLAWVDLHRETLKRGTEIGELKTENSELVRNVAHMEQKNSRLQALLDEKRDEITRLNTKLVEKPNPTNLQVSVSALNEPQANIWWSQKDFKRDPVNTPTYVDRAYTAQITIRSDRDIVQPEFKIVCTAPISGLVEAVDGMFRQSVNGQEAIIELVSPKLSPNHGWILMVYSPKPIRISELIWLGDSPRPIIKESRS